MHNLKVCAPGLAISSASPIIHTSSVLPMLLFVEYAIYASFNAMKFK